MGEVVKWPKPKVIKEPSSNKYDVKVLTNINTSEYNSLLNLIDEARNTIEEEITEFSEKAFTEESENKEKMNFRISQAFYNQKLIGFSIGYCPLDNLSEFYLDIVYVKADFRSNSLGFILACNTINSIINITSIGYIKFITQSSNVKAKGMIQKIIKYYD